MGPSADPWLLAKYLWRRAGWSSRCVESLPGVGGPGPACYSAVGTVPLNLGGLRFLLLYVSSCVVRPWPLGRGREEGAQLCSDSMFFPAAELNLLGVLTKTFWIVFKSGNDENEAVPMMYFGIYFCRASVRTLHVTRRVTNLCNSWVSGNDHAVCLYTP